MTHTVILQAPSSLKPHPQNARTHSKTQIDRIASSISQFGFNNPILVTKENFIVAGHGRWEAAKKLQMETMPTIPIEHLTPDEIRAYVLADNKLAELAGWDNGILAIELEHLLEFTDKFDIETIGFETGEVDVLIGNVKKTNPRLDDQVEKGSIASRTKPGDLWQLGNHRLLCGDSRMAKAYHALMGDQKAQMIFTDPPYNVPIDGHVCGNGEIKHREFVMAAGEMTSAEFSEFLSAFLIHAKAHLTDGAIVFTFMDWRHMQEVLQASATAGYGLKNLCVWVKDNGGMGSFYRSQHELVFVLKNGDKPHINNINLGKYGRYRTNVWSYAGANTFKAERREEFAMHPTVKPAAMVADAIKDCSRRHGIVLDPFGGSGTTLIAAEETGRQARLIEIDPAYCDVILTRWEKLTGKTATLMKVQDE